MTSSPTSSASIHTPTTAWETRSATDAMQRVADVMIAVTESFRQQFREHGAVNGPVGPNLPGELGWRASAPELVSPIIEDNHTNSSPSRPSTAPSTFDSQRIAPVSPVSPESPGSVREPTIPPLTLAGPLSSHPTAYFQTCRSTPEIRIQPPEPVTVSSNIAHGVTFQRGLAPEALTHPSEYPNLFEAARKIVIIQRGRYPDYSPSASRENLRFSTATQTDAPEDQIPWARQSHLYQAQPLLGKAPQPALTFRQEASLVAVVSLYQVLMFAGLTQAIAPALEIAETFTDMTTGQHSWFTAAYTLALGVFALPSARLGDIIGHKSIAIYGCLWFAVWCLLAGFSLSVQRGGYSGAVYMCICRAMQGIGPALCVPNGFSILEASFPSGQRRDTALSLYSAAAPFGFVIGAVMASLFAVNTAWEWSFFVLSAVCVSAAGLSAFILPRQGPRKLHSGDSIWKKLDMSGILLGATGLGLFSFAWNQAPEVGWRTPYTYFLLVIGILFLAAFFYNETAVTNPLLPMRMMNSSANLVLGCIAAGWGCFIIWALYSFHFMEVLRGWDCLLASAGFVPLAIDGIAVAVLLAYLMPGLEVYWAFVGSLMAFLLASVLMATSPTSQTYWANTFVSNLLAPLGMVMSSPLAMVLLSNSLTEEYQGTASSLVLAISAYSMSIALGIARTVEVHVNQGGHALSGLRGAQYFGFGLGGLGVVLATTLLLQCFSKRNRVMTFHQGRWA